MNQNLIDSNCPYYYNNHQCSSTNLSCEENDYKNFNVLNNGFSPQPFYQMNLNQGQNQWNQQNQSSNSNSTPSGYYCTFSNCSVNGFPSYPDASYLQKNYYQRIVTMNPAMQFLNANVMMKPGIQFTMNPMMNHMGSISAHIPYVSQMAQLPQVSQMTMPQNPHMTMAQDPRMTMPRPPLMTNSSFNVNMMNMTNMGQPQYTPPFYDHRYDVPFDDSKLMSTNSNSNEDLSNDDRRIIKVEEDSNFDQKGSNKYIAEEGYIVEEPDSDAD